MRPGRWKKGASLCLGNSRGSVVCRIGILSRRAVGAASVIVYKMKDQRHKEEPKVPGSDSLQKRQWKSGSLFISSGPSAASGTVGDAVAVSKVRAITPIDLRT